MRVDTIMGSHVPRCRRPLKPVLDRDGSWVFQLDLMAGISNGSMQTGANGATTPPPPDQDGGYNSTMPIDNSSADNVPSQPAKTYPQDWPTYNAAQTSEKDSFQILLAGLCASVSQPERRFGRPGFPLADVG